MGKLIASARLALQTQEVTSRDLQERDRFAEAANLLRTHERLLRQAYPQALLKAFAAVGGGKSAVAESAVGVHFDQLELMDESQVHSTVTLARVQQVVTLATESSLAELNTLVSSALGLPQVQPEANALRPESYVLALQDVVAQTQAGYRVQSLWVNAMSNTLGQELRALYAGLIARLRQEGVVGAPYAMTQSATANVVPAGAVSPGVAPAAGKNEAVLTLDKLRRLLSGELTASPAASRVEQFAAQFSQQFEGAVAPADTAHTDYDTTLPAALEALTEMKQVDRVVHSLEQRRGRVFNPQEVEGSSLEARRQALRREAKDVAQALSLEVMTLMVDNMAHAPQLLEPVRQVIRDMEPALLRLALVDPRFFTDKQHPARRLLQALTHQSLAFESESATGFDVFHQGLQSTLQSLDRSETPSAEAFEDKLHALQNEWALAARATQQNRDTAVEVLRHAEARNLLAEKVARSIEAHPDSGQVPAVVIDFLCGPWAQVVAQARIKQGAGSASAEKFEALIPALLWSAHPVLAHANPAKLTRLVPRLLATLREGLETIHFPGTRSGEFLEALMGIHQQVFRPSAQVPSASTQVGAGPAHERERPAHDGNPWMAPEEAAASNFVGLDGDSVLPETSNEPLLPEMLIAIEPPALDAAAELPLGSWVEMWNNGQWARMQLTWASPHGTLFLFTGVFGTTQSMSRRLRDKLVANGKLRLLSGQAFVDGALDAVAQTAVRNSMDTGY